MPESTRLTFIQAFKPSPRFPLTAAVAYTSDKSGTSISGSNLWPAATLSRSRRTPLRIGSRTGRRTATSRSLGARRGGIYWSPRLEDTKSGSPIWLPAALVTGRIVDLFQVEVV